MASDVISRLKSKSKVNVETSERIVVTPDIARSWLDQNTRNRKPSARHVEKLARDMKDGRFVFTGDATRFDRDRVLIDGQHRLLACVKADAPFETIVIYDLPTDVQNHIDAGKSRSAADILSLGGMHSATIIAAAAKLLLAEKHRVDYIRTPFTTAELMDAVVRHKELPAAVRACTKKRPPKGISVPQLTFIYYVGAYLLKLPNTADDFLGVMVTGVPSYDGDAAHAYRERMIRTGTSSITVRREDRFRLLKHAWNLFAAGTPTKLLRGAPEVWIEHVDPKML